MRRRTLLWTFFPPLLTILVLSLVLVTAFAAQAVREFILAETGKDLEHVARLTGPNFVVPVVAGDFAAVQATCREYGAITGMRFTVILADGVVVGDSREAPARMDNHADRPEVIAALAGETGRATRYSATLDHRRVYCAVAERTGAGTPFVVRTSISEAVVRVFWHHSMASWNHV